MDLLGCPIGFGLRTDLGQKQKLPHLRRMIEAALAFARSRQ